MKLSNKENVIIKQNNILYRFSYRKTLGICFECNNLSKWTNKKTIDKNAVEPISVVYDNKIIYLFYQNNAGNIIMNKLEENLWKGKTLLQRKEGNNDNINFQVSLLKNDIHIFYIIKDKLSGAEAIVHHIYYGGQNWSTPKFVDGLMHGESGEFYLCNEKDNIYLFYKNREGKFGYKKYTGESNLWSDFIIIADNGNEIISEGVLVVKEDIYAAYVRKDDFKRRLYINNRKKSWNNEKLIAEEDNIESPSMFVLDDQLYVYWISNNKLCNLCSIDECVSFSKVSITSDLQINEVIKSGFIMESYEDNKHLILNRALSNKGEDIQFYLLSEVYPNINSYLPNIPEEESIPQKSVEDSFEQIKHHMEEFQSKIYLYTKKLREKDYEISQMNYTLENKNSEILHLEYNIKILNVRIEDLLKEINSLKENNKILEEKLKNKERQIMQAESKVVERQSELIEKQNKLIAAQNEIELLKIQIEESQNNKKGKSSLFRTFFGESNK